MLRYLRKLGSGKTIFRFIRLFVYIVVVCWFGLQNGFAEDIRRWNTVPIPAPTPMPTVENNQLYEGADKPFDGAKNKPPFDLEVAIQCEQELKKRRIAFSIGTQISDEKGCFVERPLSVVELSDGLTLTNDMILRCKVVLAMDDWMKNIVRPSAKLHLGQDVKSLKTSTSYHCRTRNNKPGGKISEHGFANGVDITGFELEDDTVMSVSTNMDTLNDQIFAEAKFRAAVRAGACAYFSTVLGPGTNATHQDHFHFDLAHRKSGYRLCE